ncbi:MAG TPA: hypothetical protein VNW54_16640 [Granulicella sp.]|nr:hypothetical protein [Granulicella sp.]
MHGIEFSANQSELVKDLIRELLKDGNCVVYALPNMKPDGELRMAAVSPNPGPKSARGVFVRIRPGLHEATLIRPMNAKAGEPFSKITKISQSELLRIVRIWRKEVPSDVAPVAKATLPVTHSVV